MNWDRMTPEQKAAWEAQLIIDQQKQETIEANRATLRELVEANIAVLRASMNAMKVIMDKTNANIGPTDTKAVARENRRLARQMLALTKLFIEQLDDADVGVE